MAASTAVRQTALSLDAAFMEDAVPVVPVATTRRQTGCNLAALMILSAIGCLALGSALAPSADAPSLRRLDDAADTTGLCCILNGVDGVDFKYNDPCFCNVEDIMPRSQFSDLTPRELCDANGYGWCPSRVNEAIIKFWGKVLESLRRAVVANCLSRE